MKTPSGVDLEIGQTWEEMDSRWPQDHRKVKVLGWKEVNGEIKVNIWGFVKTWAKLSRFHGKNGGYRLKEAK